MSNEERNAALDKLREDDTAEVLKIGNTFGINQEYYCLYLLVFWFKPWWALNFGPGIEFRPFRNVRIHNSYTDNTTQRKTGYFKEWLLDPAFTYQIYDNGMPCAGKTDKTTTFVTFLCGEQNRVIGFRETKKCKYYELYFETSFNCKSEASAQIKNDLAVKKIGPEDWQYLYIFAATMSVFCFICFVLIILKKKKLY